MWIRFIPYEDSDGYLRSLYDRVKGPQGQIDNVMKVHSLRPHTMEGHSALYKSVLHHTGNALPVWSWNVSASIPASPTRAATASRIISRVSRAC